MTAVSVLVPAWQAESTLDAAIRSVLEQRDAGGIQVVVADDASSDGTLAVARRWADAHPEVIALPSPDGLNRGPGAARNRALRAADGDWIALLDADDTFLPGRLARLMDAARAQGADVVSDNLRETDPSGVPLRVRGLGTTGWVEARTYVERDLGWLQPLVRRQVLPCKGWNEARSHGEDFEWSLGLFANRARWWHLAVEGYVYVRGPASLSSRRLEGLSTSWEGTVRLLEHPEISRLPGVGSALRRRALLKSVLWRKEALRRSWLQRDVPGMLRLLAAPFGSPGRPR